MVRPDAELLILDNEPHPVKKKPTPAHFFLSRTPLSLGPVPWRGRPGTATGTSCNGPSSAPDPGRAGPVQVEGAVGVEPRVDRLNAAGERLEHLQQRQRP